MHCVVKSGTVNTSTGVPGGVNFNQSRCVHIYMIRQVTKAGYVDGAFKGRCASRIISTVLMIAFLYLLDAQLARLLSTGRPDVAVQSTLSWDFLCPNDHSDNLLLATNAPYK